MFSAPSTMKCVMVQRTPSQQMHSYKLCASHYLMAKVTSQALSIFMIKKRKIIIYLVLLFSL